MPINRRQRIRLITVHSMFIALIAIMGFVPFLGFVPIGAGVSITLVHVPVILAAAILSIKSATLLGLVFGVVSLLVVLTNPAPLPTDLLFVNPMISILPRVLFGFITGLLFHFSRGIKGYKNTLLISLLAFIASLLHTVLVLTFIWIYQSDILVTTFRNLFNFILVIISLNGFVEALLAGIVVPILFITLRQFSFVRELSNLQ